MSQEVKVDPAIIKKTQDTLGRIINAPSLTEKLLSRPPVQFVQDIVKSVIKNTGFMKGLYSADELDSAFIKASKENKLLFLNKLIMAVSVAVGEQLAVKSNKIAAGVEAEKTNELFQYLAKAINMKPDNDEVVKKTLKKLKAAEEKEDKGDGDERSREKSREKSDDTRDKSRSKKEDERSSKDRDEKHRSDKDKERDERHRGDRDKDKDRDREKERDKDKDRDREKERDKDKDRKRDSKEKSDRDKDRDRDRERERDKEKDRESRHHRDRDRDREKDKEKEKSREDKDKDRERSSRHHRDSSDKKEREEKPKSRKDSDDEDDFSGNFKKQQEQSHHRSSLHQEEEAETAAMTRDDEPNEAESSMRRRPSSARGPRVHIERDENFDQRVQQNLEENRNLARPSTARPHAPRPKLVPNDTEDIQSKLNSSLRKSSANNNTLGSSRGGRGGDGGAADSDSEDFLVIETKLQEDEAANAANRRGDGLEHKDELDDETDQHGALVKKILESKEQLDYGNDRNKEKPIVQMDMQRKKEKERVQKEIDKLKESIQTLTKASIPLGRLLDFMQEDVDMMQKEITKWSDEYENNLRALKRQQNETQSFLEPYKSALSEMESQISEQLEKVSSVKRKILLNEEKISRLIFNVGKTG